MKRKARVRIGKVVIDCYDTKTLKSVIREILKQSPDQRIIVVQEQKPKKSIKALSEKLRKKLPEINTERIAVNDSMQQSNAMDVNVSFIQDNPWISVLVKRSRK